MSSTFDTALHALAWLETRVEQDDAQAAQAIYYLKEIVDDLHSYSHDHDNVLNRVAGTNPARLRTVLKHNNPDDRQFWLEAHELA